MNRRTTGSMWRLGVCALSFVAAAGCGSKGSGSGPTDQPGGVAPPAAPAGAAPEIAGSYSVKGTNPGGGDYTGSLLITKRDKVYQFSWKSGANGYDGVGVQTGNTVGVAFSSGADGKGCSVVHYDIGANGALSGRWGAWGENGSGTESATPNAGVTGLEGGYAVSGTRLDGKPYKGTLKVSAHGPGFLFDWSTGDASQGFGIRKGSYVTVGIGGEQCGFVYYEVKPDGTLDGQWSSFKSQAIGTELATKSK